MEGSDNESSSSESTKSLSTTKKLLMCEVCAVQEAKYTCPRCEVRTCCLKCSSIHKKELHCSGLRDSTKFIPIHKFNNIDFASDYRFLEKITRNVESYKKGMGHQRYKFISKHFLLLQTEAAKQKIALKLLPNSFVKHKQNCTYYDNKSSKIMWYVEWVFALESNFKLKEKNVPDDVKLSDILQKYFVNQHESTIIQEKLQYYQSAGLSRVKLFLKAEETPGNKYFELDLDESLKVNLCNKVIIEHPVIHVVMMEHSSCYELADEKITIKGANLVDSIIMKAESDESIYKSMKNLLFLSEFSDEEEMNEADN